MYEIGIFRIPARFVGPQSQGKFSAAGSKYHQGYHLNSQSSDHDILSSVLAGNRLGSCRDTASETLQNETEEIEGAEGECVCPGLESRILSAVNGHNASKTEVDSCGKESGGDGDANEVDEEGVVVEWILV